MRGRKLVVVGALLVLLPSAILIARTAVAAGGAGGLQVPSTTAQPTSSSPAGVQAQLGEPSDEPAGNAGNPGEEGHPAEGATDEAIVVPSPEAEATGPVVETGESATVVVVPASERQRVPTQIRFRNQVGKRLKLVDAAFWIDGRPVPVPASVREAAANNGELVVFSGPVAPGPHVVTTRVGYQGAQRGPFSYVKGYRFNVENVGAFVVPTGASDAAFTIIGEERRVGAVTRSPEEGLQLRVERSMPVRVGR